MVKLCFPCVVYRIIKIDGMQSFLKILINFAHHDCSMELTGSLEPLEGCNDILFIQFTYFCSCTLLLPNMSEICLNLDVHGTEGVFHVDQACVAKCAHSEVRLKETETAW